jgi:polysaccharide biosynthesis protein PslA
LAAGALIAFTLPLMAIVALAIKCESAGPVLVREERINARGRHFTALKFRNAVYEPGGRAVRRAEIAARVTRVGWLLRYTRIENLPQLINVVRGEMSCLYADPDHPFFLD